MDVLFVSAILILSVLIVYLLWHIRHSNKMISTGEESDILTLLTEFKHVADMKIAALEDKSDKLKFQLKRANEIIARLTSTITDAEKMIDVMKTVYEDEVQDKLEMEPKTYKSYKKASVNKVKEKISNPKQSIQGKKQDNKDEKFTDKVLKLYNDGWSIDDIARMFDKGKGEIELIVNFNNLKERWYK